MKATIEIYVQQGSYGFHAGTRGTARNYAAHKTDAATAAFRAAVKHWFPSRQNNVLLYSEIRSVTIDKIGEGEFRAWLKIPDAELPEMEFSRKFGKERNENKRTKLKEELTPNSRTWEPSPPEAQHNKPSKTEPKPPKKRNR
jgi:hypothetical protein